jgi:hypothetical protein
MFLLLYQNDISEKMTRMEIELAYILTIDLNTRQTEKWTHKINKLRSNTSICV